MSIAIELEASCANATAGLAASGTAAATPTTLRNLRRPMTSGASSLFLSDKRVLHGDANWLLSGRRAGVAGRGRAAGASREAASDGPTLRPCRRDRQPTSHRCVRTIIKRYGP